MSRTTIGWALAALAGLLLAAGLTLAVSELTSQHVGLYDESPDVGRELVVSTAPSTTARRSARPSSRSARPRRRRPGPRRRPRRPPTPPPVTTTDDNRGSGGDDDGSGRGRGRSGGSDDD